MEICTLSDGSHAGGNEKYGRTRLICGLTVENNNFVFIILFCGHHISKKRFLTFFGAEILLGSDGDDCGLLILEVYFTVNFFLQTG